VPALALLPRFSAALPLPSAALLGVADAAGASTFVHRHFAALFASVPVLTAGSLVGFMLRDHSTAKTDGAAADRPTADIAASPGLTARLRPDEELALGGVVLATMVACLERDPAAYPLLAYAAAQLVPDWPEGTSRDGWTGLTERARRAAADVLRPAALATLVRAASWEMMSTGVPA
jgi:hypothetical protein